MIEGVGDVGVVGAVVDVVVAGTSLFKLVVLVVWNAEVPIKSRCLSAFDRHHLVSFQIEQGVREWSLEPGGERCDSYCA
jgi:hypothetical protein